MRFGEESFFLTTLNTLLPQQEFYFSLDIYLPSEPDAKPEIVIANIFTLDENVDTDVSQSDEELLEMDIS